jgi:hypothetical protein
MVAGLWDRRSVPNAEGQKLPPLPLPHARNPTRKQHGDDYYLIDYPLGSAFWKATS